MPKFDASSFSDVEYDFTGIKSAKDGNYIDDKGVVPEPSRHLVAETMSAISTAFNEMKLAGKEMSENPSPDEVVEAMNSLGDEDAKAFEHMADTLVEVLADFCQGSPRLDSLDALPWNRFMAFFGYLMEHMLSPEASVPGTNATPKRLRSV